jgi:hypothetical protein
MALPRFMSEKSPPEDAEGRFKTLVAAFKPKTRRFAQLLPFKSEIQQLRRQHAAFDDIRLILKDANITTSNNTILRFCRDILGEKRRRPYKPRVRGALLPKIQPMLSSPESIETALRERRERLPGPWRRKRGPHIADPKNL